MKLQMALDLDDMQKALQMASSTRDFVDIIEIADQKFAPRIKFIQCFPAVRFLAKRPIKQTYQTDRVTQLHIGQLIEQIADAQIDGRPYWLV